jgi:hypothetical protein
MSPAETLNALIDEYGWAGLLRLLVQIAEAEEFSIMASSLQPVLLLIEDVPEK